MAFKDKGASVDSGGTAAEIKNPDRIIDISEGIRDLLQIRGAKDVDSLRRVVAECCLQACDCCLQIN